MKTTLQPFLWDTIVYAAYIMRIYGYTSLVITSSDEQLRTQPWFTYTRESRGSATPDSIFYMSWAPFADQMKEPAC